MNKIMRYCAYNLGLRHAHNTKTGFKRMHQTLSRTKTDYLVVMGLLRAAGNPGAPQKGHNTCGNAHLDRLNK